MNTLPESWESILGDNEVCRNIFNIKKTVMQDSGKGKCRNIFLTDCHFTK